MSAYAFAARALGATVTGSDRAASAFADALRGAGIEVALGHDPEHVPAGSGVELVYSSAVPADNPERVAARARGLPELSRAQLLRELTALRRTIAVAGAHGKTTTAAMIAHVLRETGLDPSFLIGGVLRSAGTNAAWTDGEWLVLEADESDRSMIGLDVEIAVLTNVDLDHHTTYGSVVELREAFRAFLAPARHAVIWDRPELLALRAGPSTAYEARDVVLEAGGSRQRWRGHEVRLQIPGVHNARNAVAALEAARLAGAPEDAAAAALAGFLGAERRFQYLGRTPSGAEVYDDYAHHPTELEATIEGARSLRATRLVAVFQPHLYSRTARLADDFGRALARADVAMVLDVYPARERAEDFPGVTGRLIAETTADAAAGRPVYWMPDTAAAERTLAGLLGPGDVCLVLGAGDVDALGRRLVASARDGRAAR
jgi:UDP-N-acetylmuramate--alanine ligase